MYDRDAVRGHGQRTSRANRRLPFAQMVPLFSGLQVILCAGLIGLVLAHSGRDAGFGGIGFTPASQGGTHIVERNLTRITVVVAILFAINTVLLYRLLG